METVAPASVGGQITSAINAIARLTSGATARDTVLGAGVTGMTLKVTGGNEAEISRPSASPFPHLVIDTGSSADTSIAIVDNIIGGCDNVSILTGAGNNTV